MGNVYGVVRSSHTANYERSDLTQQRISRGGFIKLGGALGVGVAGASLLAGCGSSSGGGSGSGGGEGSGDEVIAQESEVSPGSAVEFTDGGGTAVLVHLENGDFAAYSAVCTHQGCDVAYNQDEGTLDCPCHGSVFDPANGASVESGPAGQPLPEIPVEVRNGEVVKA